MAEVTTPPWAVEGAAVAVCSSSIHGYTVIMTTIERLTATQVVCANGRRFRRTVSGASTEGLEEVGKQYGPVLLPAYHKDVRTVFARGVFRDFKQDIDALFHERPDKGEIGTMLAALDRITKLAAATHADISKFAEGDQDEKES